MQESISESLAYIIRSEMAGQRLSVESLAKALSVHVVTASRIRNGQSTLDVNQLGILAVFLGTDAESLLSVAAARMAGDAA